MSETPKIRLRGLSKAFGAKQVLDGVDLTIEQGESLVIIGRSGGGKSVLLKHIIGLEEPDAGEILIEGQGINTEGLRDRYRMAMVFQSGALLNSLTVGENVGLYLREHRLKPEAEIRRIIAEKLDIVGLKGAEEKIPGELSGGMKKRVALARALVIEPQLILYDEPTSELDPLIAITIGQEILALRDRTHATSLVVTHDRDLAFGIADRIAMIADGEILEIGRPEDVRRSQHPLVRKFLTADFKPKPQ